MSQFRWEIGHIPLRTGDFVMIRESLIFHMILWLALSCRSSGNYFVFMCEIAFTLYVLFKHTHHMPSTVPITSHPVLTKFYEVDITHINEQGQSHSCW